ncbi:MAG: twitching motility protein PilT [Eubacteriales bacterium]|nr:twitching motility protein PilT [Eubacteriales bacterium]
MVELIVGGKGKGKTKVLLDRAAEAVKTATGNVVYVDKSKQHMYELSNKIRLVDVTEYPIAGEDGFLSFLSGIIASDHDLEYVLLDSFLKVTGLECKDITSAITTIKKLSDKFGVNFVVSISMDKEELPEVAKELVSVAL